MTKPVTGIAAMLLIEDGKMKLDQPIADFLPAFAKMQVQNTPDGSITDLRPAKTQITVRHLLTHTAGLGYNIIQKGPIKKAYDDAGIVGGSASRLPIPGLAPVTPAPSLAVMADRLAALPLIYEPGTKWSYSISLDLLGRVIEVVSGQPFDAFLKARLFDPLGMTSTSFMVGARDVGRFTTNYAPYGGALIPFDPGDQLDLSRSAALSVRRRRVGVERARLRPLPRDAAWRGRNRRETGDEGRNRAARDVEPDRR